MSRRVEPVDTTEPFETMPVEEAARRWPESWAFHHSPQAREFYRRLLADDERDDDEMDAA